MRTIAITLALAIAPPVSAQTIVVTHAEAWTMESAEPVRDATIVIENGRIVSVSAGGAVPGGATVIDAHGKPVTPGFVNGATQLGLIEVRLVFRGIDREKRIPLGDELSFFKVGLQDLSSDLGFNIHVHERSQVPERLDIKGDVFLDRDRGLDRARRNRREVFFLGAAARGK